MENMSLETSYEEKAVFMKPSTRLRKLLSQDGVCIQAPGVYDGICARIAIEQGFQVMVCLQPHL
jgi:2-methylisocitrate lyase-like PEP mutase family enzyme